MLHLELETANPYPCEGGDPRCFSFPVNYALIPDYMQANAHYEKAWAKNRPCETAQAAQTNWFNINRISR